MANVSNKTRAIVKGYADARGEKYKIRSSGEIHIYKTCKGTGISYWALDGNIHADGRIELGGYYDYVAEWVKPNQDREGV